MSEIISSYWVMSAKKEETRLRRLETLIDDSAHNRTILPLTRPARSGGKVARRSLRTKAS